MNRLARRQALGVLALVAVAGVATFLFSPTGVARGLSGLADRPVLFITLLTVGYLLRFLVAWPISAFSVLVGFTLGTRAIPLALAGAVVTCFPPYLLANRFGERGPLGTLAGHGRRYFTATGDLRGIVAARLAPLPADAVSYTAGLAGVSPGAYALGTALGELPWVTAAVIVGASAETLRTGNLAGWRLVVGAAALAVLLLAGPASRALTE